VAQRVGRSIALLFHDHGTRRGEWSAAHPGCTLTPGKDQVPIVQGAGCAPGLVWTVGKSRPYWDSILNGPALSQSLYRLTCPIHIMLMGNVQKSRVRMHFSRNQQIAVPSFGAGIFLDGSGSQCRYLHFINSTTKDTPYPKTPKSRIPDLVHTPTRHLNWCVSNVMEGLLLLQMVLHTEIGIVWSTDI